MLPRDRSNMVAWSEEEEAAVVMIQSNYRGHAIRKKLSEKHEAATTIQSNYRGYEVRKDLQKQDDAAAKIQAQYRDYAHRKKLPSSKYTEVDPATGRWIRIGGRRRRTSVIVFSDGIAVRKTKKKKKIKAGKKKKTPKKPPPTSSSSSSSSSPTLRIRSKGTGHGDVKCRRIVLYKNGDPLFPPTSAVVTEKAIVQQALGNFLSELDHRFDGYVGGGGDES